MRIGMRAWGGVGAIALCGVLAMGPRAKIDVEASPDGSPDVEVMATVERLFDGMRARDGAQVRAAFHPDARLTTTRLDASGAPVVSHTPIDSFADAVDAGGDPWNEPYWDPVVQVDGALAQVWIFYRFYAGERFSHCGHNAIQLVLDADRGWEILSLVDTRRTDACEPPGG